MVPSVPPFPRKPCTPPASSFQLSPPLLKDVLRRNILCIVVTLDTFQLEISPLKVLSLNISCIFCTFDVFQLEISPLKVQPSNISCIFCTFDTSQLEISPLNVTSSNNPLISVTFDTSQLLGLPYVVDEFEIHAFIAEPRADESAN